MEEQRCSGAEGMCERPARKAGLCWGHWKRKMRGQTLNVELWNYRKSPADYVKAKGILLADADTSTSLDEAFVGLTEQFRESMRRWAWRYVHKWIRRQRVPQEAKDPFIRILESKPRRRL